MGLIEENYERERKFGCCLSASYLFGRLFTTVRVKEDKDMGLLMIAAVVCVLIACGAVFCLMQEKHNRTAKSAYYIGKELRHGFQWIKMILQK